MSDILIPGRAHIYLAPTGTAAPIDAVVTMPTGWLDVGLTAPDSLQFVENPGFVTVNSHQSDFASRIAQISDEGHLQVDLEDFTGANLLNVFGGGSLTTVVAASAGPPAVKGVYRYAPPKIGGRSSVSACAEFVDGTKHYRLIVPVAFQDAGVTLKLSKTTNTTLPLALAVQGSDGVDPYYFLTDDPLWVPSI